MNDQSAAAFFQRSPALISICCRALTRHGTFVYVSFIGERERERENG